MKFNTNKKADVHKASVVYFYGGKKMTEYKTMGYARVSSSGQNLDRQLIELKKYVSEENIIIDKQSGKDFNRPGYQALKGILGLRKGDCLVIKSLDRLSRNKEEMKKELKWFKDNGICLKVIDLPTMMVELGEGQEWIRDMVNNILIEVLSSIAEEERRMIRRRQREGIDAAKAAGKVFGRPQKEYPENWEIYYLRYKSGELTRRYILEKMGIGVDRFRYLQKKYEKQNTEMKKGK